MLDEDDDVTLDVDALGKLDVPANLEAVAAAIEQMRSTDPASAFQDAQMGLDRVVAGLFGMSEEDLDYITSAMTNDGFLKQLKPCAVNMFVVYGIAGEKWFSCHQTSPVSWLSRWYVCLELLPPVTRSWRSLLVSSAPGAGTRHRPCTRSAGEMVFGIDIALL